MQISLEQIGVPTVEDAEKVLEEMDTVSDWRRANDMFFVTYTVDGEEVDEAGDDYAAVEHKIDRDRIEAIGIVMGG